MTRQTKTPEQRASEALGVAMRAEIRNAEKVTAAHAQLAAAQAAHGEARDRLAYVALDPALSSTVRADVTAHLDATGKSVLNGALSEVVTAAQAARDASQGDSNDDEIRLLWAALETALEALGVQVPESDD